MTRRKKDIAHDLDTLAHDVRELLSATSEVTGEKLTEARERLSDAFERGKDVYSEVKAQAVETAKAGDKLFRSNPYAAVSIALGVGALIGALSARRH